ncbi:ABC transporter ATP-binding protein [Haloferax volcanii]|uniref:Cobalt ABC transporter ATP-binding protein n=3 Tax=Haloferax volcanii TaxID=2246 RepID=A0A384KVK7_HALVD|nr:ABC transporter ATP-binding protein [Haloferax volcanii]ADE01376.1 ABC-type transport system ATP-binding protein [Haloferax volcanii DS2]ELY36402.1 cobalt ABC transporter ATP-binding protein [Haloferax volcanii DS2]MBS8120351.1 energy-coupling factor ABC transporter ATP-binding protein [Haloferax volcanii]MBS8125388.1 energy-coupling factor ABC transporter ATP-binding protein [Haloferax volcanii]MBS8129255.1 energy-coupling factor ABC transporter ATP-binding protein [Haloferax volcanii]
MSSNNIVVEDLTFQYPGGDEAVLRDASVTIEPGEFTAVVGGNGSGKTTLCKTFNGLIPHFFEGTFDGRVSVAGTDTRESDVAELSKTVGYVFQDFENQLVQETVRDDVEFAPLNHGLDDYAERATRALETLGLDHLEDRFIWELSGGQQHLVALAGVLAMDPEFIFVDEPAAQLDPRNARETYEQLRRLNEERDKTVIVIEHHSEFIADYCDEMVLVSDGGVAWKEPVEVGLNRLDDLLAHDIHPPQVTQIADGLPSEAGTLPSGRYPVTVDEAATAFQPATARGSRAAVDGGAVATAGADTGGAPTDGEQDRDALVTMRGVGHGYPTLREGYNHVLDGLDLELHAGDRVALVGANGSGKSTLLRLLTGVESPDRGTVTVLGRDTSETLPEQLADDTVYIHQNPEEMFVEDTVRKDIAYYLENRDTPNVDDRVDEILAYLDLEHLADRDGRLMSLGQQRRASLGIGLATDPTVVLLDEPTGSLDLQSRREVTGMLRKAESRVETVVVASHDLQLVAAWANRVLVMGEGEVLADAPPAAVFSDPDLLAETDLRQPQVVELSRRLGLESPALSTDAMCETLARSLGDDVVEAGGGGGIGEAGDSDDEAESDGGAR